jgi:DNA-binding NarL/FixJ family response regulator
MPAVLDRLRRGRPESGPETDGRLVDRPADTLTAREHLILQLIGEGLTNRQIGQRMGLAEKTVKNYTSHLLAKLGLERRTQAAILATELRDRAGN